MKDKLDDSGRRAILGIELDDDYSSEVMVRKSLINKGEVPIL